MTTTKWKKPTVQGCCESQGITLEDIIAKIDANNAQMFGEDEKDDEPSDPFGEAVVAKIQGTEGFGCSKGAIRDVLNDFAKFLGHKKDLPGLCPVDEQDITWRAGTALIPTEGGRGHSHKLGRIAYGLSREEWGDALGVTARDTEGKAATAPNLFPCCYPRRPTIEELREALTWDIIERLGLDYLEKVFED